MRLAEPAPHKPESFEMAQAAAIELEGVSKHFVRPLPRLRRLLKRGGPEVVRALTSVSLRVEAGELFGLVGRNGQGKTTLIKATCGLLEPSSGTARVFGHDTVRALHQVKRKVGLVSADERSFYYRLTGRENLVFFARLQGLEGAELTRRIDTLAETFELRPVLERSFQEYSSGNKQRLAIVRALLPDPPLLLLDEPTRSLDPISAEGLRRALRAWQRAGQQAGQGDKTVLITTHNLAEIEQLCERVAILSRGQVIECETLATLRQKYARGEAVELLVAGTLDDTLLGVLRAEVGELEHTVLSEGRARLRIERHADDDRLQRLIERVLAARLRIVGCDTQPFGLMQVLEIVEARAKEQHA